MYKSLESLYYTTIETETMPAEYWKENAAVSETIRAQEKILCESLNDQQIQQLYSLFDCFSKQEDIGMRYSFITGFRLASQILSEALSKES